MAGTLTLKLVDAEADQQRERPAGRTRCHRRPRPSLPAACAPRTACRDQPEHRRVQPVDLRGELRVPAVHRERVLREVVGADGEEVDLGGELARPSPRRTAPRTMIPTGTGTTPSAARSSSKIALANRKSSMVAIIGNITLILAPASTARRIARTWVRRISGRSSPTRMPRMPEERVLLLGDRQVGQRLVAADVQGADDQRLAGPQRPGDVGVDLAPARPRSARCGARGRRTPSAAGRRPRRPSSSAASASSRPPMLATTSMWWPSVVSARSSACSSSMARRSPGVGLAPADPLDLVLGDVHAAACPWRRPG